MIVERIKRKIEPGLYIVPQSTPIIYFGNYDNAKACTISLNPSNKEFVYNKNELLDYRKKERLCSRKILNKSDSDVLSADDAEIVLKYCKECFYKNPFNTWFKPFNYFISQYGGYSYYNGTCVHLDLVQWATFEKWSKVPENIKQLHIKNDLPVLKYLLEKDFEIIFLNGETTVNNVCNYLEIDIIKKPTIFTNINGSASNLIVYTGKYNKTHIVGWNPYLQSAAVGGNENKQILCNTIKK